MKTKIYLVGIISLILLVSGCDTGDNFLNVKLYDKNKNLISQSIIQPQAVVQGVPNVKFISVQTSVTNTGNIELTTKSWLTVPKAIELGFIENNKQFAPNPHCVGDDGGQMGNMICFAPIIKPGESYTYSSGLVDVEDIREGQYNLRVLAWGYNKEEEVRTVNVERSFLLTIEKDPIDASIKVNIGISKDTPPPPCILECPGGMQINNNECISKPINILINSVGAEIVCPKEAFFDRDNDICRAELMKICPVHTN